MCSGQNQWEEATEWINTFRGREKGVIIIITPEKDRMSGGHGRPLFSLFCPPTVGVCRRNCVFLGEGWWRKRERCYPHFREPVVCKALSLDIASAEERLFPFFHSLRYTLINLLKAATPVSSSLTHLKRQTALNPTRIFSMDASKGKKNQPSPATDSSLSPGLKVKLKGRQAHTLSSLLMAVGQIGSYWWLWNPCNHHFVCPLPIRQQPLPFPRKWSSLWHVWSCKPSRGLSPPSGLHCELGDICFLSSPLSIWALIQ